MTEKYTKSESWFSREKNINQTWKRGVFFLLSTEENHCKKYTQVITIYYISFKKLLLQV